MNYHSREYICTYIVNYRIQTNQYISYVTFPAIACPGEAVPHKLMG